MVIAPHPDDETLGAGGLIAALNAVGGRVSVAYLTDGSGSHKGSKRWSRARIARLRSREAGAALRQLGHPARPVRLGWSDAQPFDPKSTEYATSVRRLVSHCRQRGVRNIVTTWGGDPHCDHQAAAMLATDVSRQTGITPFFYSVWGWALADVDRRMSSMRATAIPTNRWRAPQQRALNQHRSQLGGQITDATERFVLPRSMRRLVRATHALLLEDRHAPRTID